MPLASALVTEKLEARLHLLTLAIAVIASVSLGYWWYQRVSERALSWRDRLASLERRKVPVEEVSEFEEMGCTGTAAVITPVALVHNEGEDIELPGAPGPKTQELYRLLTGIQTGAIEDTRGWVVKVS